VSNGSAASHVVKTMENLSPKKVYLLMKELQGMILAQPDKVRQLLSEQPQLCYALLQALLRMNMVDLATAEAMLTAPAGGPAPAPAPVPAAAPPPRATYSAPPPPGEAGEKL
jgi:cleavage stimulation factor subunit 2